MTEISFLMYFSSFLCDHSLGKIGWKSATLIFLCEVKKKNLLNLLRAIFIIIVLLLWTLIEN